MMKPITTKILPVDVPSPQTGFIYTTETILTAIDARRTYGVYGTILQDNERAGRSETDIGLISHVVHSLRIEDGWLQGDVVIYSNTPKGGILAVMRPEDLWWSLNGIGKLTGNTVFDYSITSIDAVLKDRQ